MSLVLKERFHDVEIQFIELEGQFYFPVTRVARALGYSDPASAATNIIKRNEDELQDHVRVVNLTTPQGMQRVRVIDEQGLYIFTMLSRTHKAKEFRKWVSRILVKLRAGQLQVQDSAVSLFSPEDRQAIRELVEWARASSTKMTQIEVKVTQIEQQTQQLARHSLDPGSELWEVMRDAAEIIVRRTGLSFGAAVKEINAHLCRRFPYLDCRKKKVYRQVRLEDFELAKAYIRRFAQRFGRGLESYR